MSLDTSTWAQQCPLCGSANQCAVAQGLPPEHCWCMTSTVSPEALARLPAAERGQRCICPACGKTSSVADGVATTPPTAAAPELR